METQNLEQNPDSQKRTDRLASLTYRLKTLPDRGVGAIEGAILVLVILIPLSVQAGFFNAVSGIINGTNLTYEKDSSSQTASEVKLLSANISPDPKANQGGGDVIVEEGALMGSGPFIDDGSGETLSSGEISVHTVRECTEDRCETLSHIAEMYGVSVNTILWANDITDPNLIQPGDSLLILPITGVRHIVKDKESLATIAKKYGAETDEQVQAMVSDIVAYNRLASASAIATGDTVVVPGGVMHSAPAVTKKSSTPTKTKSGSAVAAGGGGFVHPVPGAVRTQGIHGYNAVDLAIAAGTPIRAAAGGEVIVSKNSGWNGGYGNYVVIKHNNGSQTLYAHASSMIVSVGDTVSSGETIGYVGTSGRSTGAHLHFEVRGATNPF